MWAGRVGGGEEGGGGSKKFSKGNDQDSQTNRERAREESERVKKFQEVTEWIEKRTKADQRDGGGGGEKSIERMKKICYLRFFCSESDPSKLKVANGFDYCNFDVFANLRFRYLRWLINYH